MLDETVIVNHSDDMFAPVGLLRVAKCHTEPKDPAGAGSPSSSAPAPTPGSTTGTTTGVVPGLGGVGQRTAGDRAEVPAAVAAAVSVEEMSPLVSE